MVLVSLGRIPIREQVMGREGCGECPGGHLSVQGSLVSKEEGFTHDVQESSCSADWNTGLGRGVVRVAEADTGLGPWDTLSGRWTVALSEGLGHLGPDTIVSRAL